jgi:hypothetical protein
VAIIASLLFAFFAGFIIYQQTDIKARYESAIVERELLSLVPFILSENCLGNGKSIEVKKLENVECLKNLEVSLEIMDLENGNSWKIGHVEKVKDTKKFHVPLKYNGITHIGLLKISIG